KLNYIRPKPRPLASLKRNCVTNRLAARNSPRVRLSLTWRAAKGASSAAMPQLTATAVLQLVLLLSAVPAQYYISRWSGSTVAQRYHASTRSLMDFGQEVAPESLAIEAMIFDNDQEFFGASKAVRSPRPPYVFLRVGEVVMERKGYMVGVVVSWDSELRAPPQWVDRVYSSSEAEGDGHPRGGSDCGCMAKVKKGCSTLVSASLLLLIPPLFCLLLSDQKGGTQSLPQELTDFVGLLLSIFNC
ncbi:hypothetical protein FQN60_015893, partial [Etheostoma spectabile]